MISNISINNNHANHTHERKCAHEFCATLTELAATWLGNLK